MGSRPLPGAAGREGHPGARGDIWEQEGHLGLVAEGLGLWAEGLRAAKLRC